MDFISIVWLEKYLKTEFSGLLLFVSHDVEFINRLADQILDVDYGEIRQYSGHYGKFLAEKQLIIEQKLQEKRSVELKIASMQRFVDRFRASANRAKMAQSRVKKIAKLEIPEIKESSRSSPLFQFKSIRPSGKWVIRVKGLAKKILMKKKLFQSLNFEIKRGEKVAIMGENGIGKSTPIKILLNILPPDQGAVEWGYETQLSYFSQDHHDLLNKNTSVLAWLDHYAAGSNEQFIRKILAQRCFSLKRRRSRTSFISKNGYRICKCINSR